jgi:hypothetical protein
MSYCLSKFMKLIHTFLWTVYITQLGLKFVRDIRSGLSHGHRWLLNAFRCNGFNRCGDNKDFPLRFPLRNHLSVWPDWLKMASHITSVVILYYGQRRLPVVVDATNGNTWSETIWTGPLITFRIQCLEKSHVPNHSNKAKYHGTRLRGRGVSRLD